MSPYAEGSRTPGAAVAASSSTDLSFPNRSALKQRILSEEAYSSTLSQLIKRDFFPHLERLEAENAYLDALTNLDEDGGEERLERAVRRLVGHEIREGIVPPSLRSYETVQRSEIPFLSPRNTCFDETTPRLGRQGLSEWEATPVAEPFISTPVPDARIDQTEENVDEGPSLQGLTLSSFQAQYTSEDNASFLEILKANEAKRKEKYKWAYNAEKRANEKRKALLSSSQLQAQAGFQAGLDKAPLDVKKRIEAGQHPRLITSNGEIGHDTLAQKDKESTSLPLVGIAEVSPAMDEAKSLQSWPHRARNALFYGPDADRSTHSQRTSSLPLSKMSSTGGSSSSYDDEVLPDRAPGINLRNTRLLDDDEADEGSKGSETPRSSRIDAAIGRGWASSASRAGESQESMADTASSANATGYDFVSPLPSPRPGDLGEERVRQLMTWGTIIGTPRVARAGVNGEAEEDHYDGSFRIPPTPTRDLLARRLADKSNGSRKRSAVTPTNQQKSKRKNWVDLSPAAKSLLDRTSRGTTSLGSSLMSSRRRAEEVSSDRLRRERWTPSPSPRK